MKDLSILKRRFFPSFYANEAPKLIEFFKCYLEWLEFEGNPYWTINSIEDFTSIDGSIDTYIEYLKNELMIDFPLEYAGDLRYIMHHLVMLYQSKGTIKSLKFLFRAIYNSFCDISYPRDMILKASDGKWNQGYYVYTNDIEKEQLSSLIGKGLTEIETGITGVISDIQPHYFEGESELKYCLIISDNRKPFTIGNTIKVYGTDIEFTITQSEYSRGYWSGTDGFISSDKILQDGYYYQNFSYVITSLVSISEYKELVEKLFHPAGLKMFGRVQLAESVEPISKNRTSFLRWWIIQIFMHVLAEEKLLLLHTMKIKNQTYPYNFPFTADQQYYTKLYGIVDRVSDISPNELYNRTNDSNKLFFSNETLVDIDWINYKIPENVNDYTIAGILSKYPVIKTTCTNGVITINNDNKTSDTVFIFVNGVKIRDSYVTKTSTGFKLYQKLNGTAVIYSLESNLITRVIKQEINNTNKFTFKYSLKERILPFINGSFVWNNVKYNNDSITLPASTGYLELYELKNNESLFVKHYTIMNNTQHILYCNSLLKNLLM